MNSSRRDNQSRAIIELAEDNETSLPVINQHQTVALFWFAIKENVVPQIDKLETDY